MFKFYPNALEFPEHGNNCLIQKGSDNLYLTFSLRYVKDCPDLKKQ